MILLTILRTDAGSDAFLVAKTARSIFVTCIRYVHIIAYENCLFGSEIFIEANFEKRGENKATMDTT
jgi:hypothetical protein